LFDKSFLDSFEMQCNQEKQILTITTFDGQRSMDLSYGKHSPLASGETPYPINTELLFKLFDCSTNGRLSSSELEELSQMQKVYNFPELKVFPNMGEMSYLDFKFLVLNNYLSFRPDRDFESFLLQALDRNDLLVLQKAHDKGIRLAPPMISFPPGTYDFKSLEALKWLESNGLLYEQETFLLERCFVNDLDDCLQYLLDQGYLQGSSKMVNAAIKDGTHVPIKAPKCMQLLKAKK
jgi:hypothetical protein